MLLTLLLTAIGSTVSQPAPVHSNYLLTLTPKDAVAVLAIGNIDDWRSNSLKNSFCRFGQDEEVAKLIEHFTGNLMEEASREFNLDQLLGSEFDEAAFLSALNGSVVVFTQLVDNNPENPIVGLMLELGDDRSGFDQLLGGLLERFKSEVVLSGSEHGGIQIMSASGKNLQEPFTVKIAELGDAVVIVGSQSDKAVGQSITEVVDRWSGDNTDGGLLGTDDFKKARGAQDFDPHVEFHVNIGAFWDGLKASGQLHGSPVPESILNEIGQITWLHGGASIGDGEQLDFQIALSMPKEGLISSFRYLLGGIPVDLLKQVPRQSSSLSTVNLDYQGIFNMALDLLHSFAPDEFAKAQQALQGVAAMGIDIEGDFLNQLTGGQANFSVEVPSSESSFGMASSMFGAVKGDSPVASYGSAALIGLLDSARVETAVDNLVEMFWQQEVGSKIVNEHEIKSINFGMAGIHWAFTESSLLIGMQPTPIAEAIRMLDEGSISVMDKGRFADPILKNRKATNFSIYETQDNLKSIIAGLQSASRMLPMVSMMTGWKPPKGFPINPKTPWPSPSIVSRYFEGTIYSAFTWDENSLRFRLSAE
ncbi:MAG: hypothetical protein ACI8TQ_001935 [Planctomycetota bacterium]|jgi:hypothetical protein